MGQFAHTYEILFISVRTIHHRNNIGYHNYDIIPVRIMYIIIRAVDEYLFKELEFHPSAIYYHGQIKLPCYFMSAAIDG